MMTGLRFPGCRDSCTGAVYEWAGSRKVNKPLTLCLGHMLFPSTSVQEKKKAIKSTPKKGVDITRLWYSYSSQVITWYHWTGVSS